MERRSSGEFYRLLFEAVAKGGFQNIAQAAYSYIKKPIVLIDVEYKVLAQVPLKPLNDLVWDTLLQQHIVPTNMIWRFNQDRYVQYNRENMRSFYVDWGMVSGLPRIMSSVRVDSEIKGYIGVLYVNDTYKPEDLEDADALAQAFALQFHNLQIRASEVQPLRNVFMAKLFSGEINSSEELNGWINNTNIGLKGGYCVVAACPALFNADPSMIQYLHLKLEKRLPSVYSVVFNEYILLLITKIPVIDVQSTFEKRIKKFLEDSFQELRLIGGMSERFDSLLEIKTFLYQAKQSLILRKEKESPLIYAYRDLVMEDIFSKIKSGIEPRNYLHPALHILSSNDAANHTEYYLTLKTYITSICNSSKTSSALNIHRNTLLYRLERITELTGISFSNSDTITHLLFSFYCSMK